MNDIAFRISHLQIRVRDIAAAVEDFRYEGFDVDWRTDAPNAFIWFDEGPFLELFTTMDRLRFITPVMGLLFGRPMGRRFAAWVDAPDGLCDIVIIPRDEKLAHPDHLGRCRAVVEAIPGVRGTRVMQSSRASTIDGSRIRFSFMALDPLALPLLASAYDIPQNPGNCAHPNGARGLDWVAREFTDTEWMQVTALLGEAPERLRRSGLLPAADFSLIGLDHQVVTCGVTIAPGELQDTIRQN